MFVLKKAEPEWLILVEAAGEQPAVRVKFRPVNRTMRRHASYAASEAAGVVPGQDPAELSLYKLIEAGEVGAEELIRAGIVEWEGIVDEAGAPLPVTAEAIEMFLDDEALFAAARRLYADPAAQRVREKNGSSASPNGIGEAETAGSDTASSPAATGSGANGRAKAAARNARIASSSSKRPRPRRSGKS